MSDNSKIASNMVLNLTFFLLVLLYGCDILNVGKDDPKVNDGVKDQWERVDQFKGADVHWLEATDEYLYMSLVIDSLPEGTLGRGKLLRTSDGENWDVINESSNTSGPIFISGDTLGWVTKVLNVFDGKKWNKITPERGSLLYPTKLQAIILHKGSWYGSYHGRETYEISEGGDFETVLPVHPTSEHFNGENHEVSGARYYVKFNDQYLAIYGTGNELVGNGFPFIFDIYDARLLGSSYSPEPRRRYAPGALQVNEGQIYICSHSPSFIRVLENDRWVAITDTIPSFDHTGVYSSRYDNPAQYIEFTNNRIYVSTQYGAVMYWSTEQRRWIFERKGLPRSPRALELGIEDRYLTPHYFELFKGRLFTGYGLNEPIHDYSYHQRISGLYTKQIKKK